MGAVEGMGGRIILMASRALAAVASGPEDYLSVYDRILSQVREPVIIHWLGEMFDPALEGYWGSGDHWQAMDTCLEAISAHPDKVDGIKVSLLSKEKEVAMRKRLPAGVRMYTGDDFNYAELIAGDGEHFSDALLGIFDAIAPAASAGLAALGNGKSDTFFEHPRADRAAVAPHLQGADALLQDGCRLPCLSEWTAGPFPHGRRTGKRAFSGAPGRALPPGRQSSGARRPGRRGGADGPLPRRARDCLRRCPIDA